MRAGLGVWQMMNRLRTESSQIDIIHLLSSASEAVGRRHQCAMTVSSSLTGPCENIFVSDCTVESHSCALKIGTESFSPFRNISFEDMQLEGSNRGLGIFSRDGGTVDGVRFSRIKLDCHETPAGFWGQVRQLQSTRLIDALRTVALVRSATSWLRMFRARWRARLISSPRDQATYPVSRSAVWT